RTRSREGTPTPAGVPSRCFWLDALREVPIDLLPTIPGRQDAGGDHLVAQLAEVLVAVAEGRHIFLVAARDAAAQPLGRELRVRGHHDTGELALAEVGAARPGISAVFDARAEHFHALVGR